MKLDDLRILGFPLDAAVPLFCEEPVERQIRQTFAYAFADPEGHSRKFATPKIRFERIADGVPFELLGLRLLPIRIRHGLLPIPRFRIGGAAFLTDVSTIPVHSRELPPHVRPAWDGLRIVLRPGG